jgi:type IX secretion system PorP/SprF family membrane protein
MKKSFIILTSALVMGINTSTAQQIALNSMYLFNETLINPGAAGSKEYIPIHTNFRKQWAGFAGSPTTQAITSHAHVGKRMGVGGTLFNDVAGPSRRSGININTSYHLRLDQADNHRIGLGLGLSFTQNTIDVNKLTTYLPEDPAVTRGFNNQMVPDANFGAYYYYKDKGFFGVSAHNLAELQKDLYNFNDIVYNPLVRTYYAMGGYHFDLKHGFGIRTTGLFQMIESFTYQFDVTAMVTYKNMLWLGGSYRHTDSYVILGGVQFGAFKVGYAYDYTISDIMNHSTGSHEVFMEIQLFPTTNQTINTPWLQRNRIYSPRI